MWWPSSIKLLLLVVAVDIIDGSGFGGSREGEQQQLTNSYQDSVSPGDLAKALAALNATMSGQIVDLRAQVADLRSQLHPEARDGAKKPGNAGTNRMPEQEQPPLHVHGVHVAADSQQAKPLPLAATCSAGGPAESCEENRFGFVCSPFNGGEPCCTCKFNCTPVVTRMIACTAKTGSVMYGACTPTCVATPSLTSLDPLPHPRLSHLPRLFARYDNFRKALCATLPDDCVWLSPMGGAAGLNRFLEPGTTLQGTQWPQLVPGVADYRLLVSIRDPFKWLVSSYLFYGLRGQVR